MSVAKVIWGVIASCFGVNIIPCNIEQCWAWVKENFPILGELHGLGIGAVYWCCRLNPLGFGQVIHMGSGKYTTVAVDPPSGTEGVPGVPPGLTFQPGRLVGCGGWLLFS